MAPCSWRRFCTLSLTLIEWQTSNRGGKAIFYEGIDMVIATIRVMVSAGNRHELVRTLRSLQLPIRKQLGCVASHLYLEIGDENTLCLIEEWASQEDLDNHFRSSDFAVLLGAINLLRGPTEIDFKLLLPTAGIEAVTAVRGENGL